MLFRKYAYFILVLMSIPGDASARLKAVSGNVRHFLDRADVIVKGEVLETKEIGRADFTEAELKKESMKSYLKNIRATAYVAHIRVDRVIKGDVKTPTIDVRFYRSGGDSFIDFAPKEYTLVFLKRQGEGLDLLDVDYAKFPASRRPPTIEVKGRAAGDLLVEEFQKLAQESDAVSNLAAIQGLADLGGADAHSTLARLSKDDRLAIRARAISGLVKLGDKSALNDMVSLLMNDRLNSSSLVGPEEQEARMYFVYAIASIDGKKIPADGKVLAELVDHKDPFIRKSAIRALRLLKSPGSEPALVKLLDDVDKDVQYSAVIALCEMARPKQEGCPSSILFERDRPKYLSEWKEWWSKKRK